MDSPRMLTAPGAGFLAEAFPERLRADAMTAAQAVHRQIHPPKPSDRFAVFVEGEAVLVPGRLHFVANALRETLDPRPSLMARCLETRSLDGFQRQRAVREVLIAPEPWSAPFVVALVGEYVIEVLRDIEAAMSPALAEILAAFARSNPDYWTLTRQRAASYWDAYYRISFRRADYVGFTLVERIDAALKAAERD